ncbi:MAG TPA: RNA methyltransferase [Anaerolineales bacterium]|nr:RNA methyltransferase [Anaerolineales bacterium]
MDITSPQNPRVKHLVRLRDDKKTRKADGLMLVEGFDEIQLAIAAGHIPQTLLSSSDLASRRLTFSSAETLSVSRPVFEKISYRENPDGWMGVFPIPNTTFESLESASSSYSKGMLAKVPLVVVAESIEKPGNLGAILRTADAAGVDVVLLCDARADAWNPNVVRASRGAVFSVPIVECDNASAWEWLKSRTMRLVAASPAGDVDYFQADLRDPLAIAVGTEDAGLSDFWMKNADVKVKIPMMGKVNSLNVSVSTALILYEAVRQRGGR